MQISAGGTQEVLAQGWPAALGAAILVRVQPADVVVGAPSSPCLLCVPVSNVLGPLPHEVMYPFDKHLSSAYSWTTH